MALSSGYSKEFLHRCSKRSVEDEKTKRGTLTFGTAAVPEENPKIPDPSLFDMTAAQPENDNTRLPTVAECASHLELLEAFYHIRLKVSSSTSLDAALGIKPEPRTVYRTTYLGYPLGYSREKVKIRDDTFLKRGMVKWPFYLELAAARFLRWVQVVKNEQDKSGVSKDKSLHLPPIGRLK
jgi:hypothetical protein